jgi:hypothetical protein
MCLCISSAISGNLLRAEQGCPDLCHPHVCRPGRETLDNPPQGHTKRDDADKQPWDTTAIATSVREMPLDFIRFFTQVGCTIESVLASVAFPVHVFLNRSSAKTAPLRFSETVAGNSWYN